MIGAIDFGAIVPFYVGLTSRGKLYSFEGQAGRPAALLLLGALGGARVEEFLRAFQARRREFETADADIVALATDPVQACFEYGLGRGIDLLIGADAGEFIAACRVDTPAVLVMDANRTLIGRYFDVTAEEAVGLALNCLGGIPHEPPVVVAQQAPVLLLHNVISPEFCRELIELFEKGGHFDSGFMTIDRQGQSVLKIDHKFKQRRDHFVSPDHPMNRRLLDLIISRIAPEIVKAFHVEVAHCERFLISCYDEGGFFNRHRDNLDRANAHRQFAITLNLNSDYEGGYLIFPEFGPHRYRPGAGEAVIFSGSLLHEAQPVTRGKRYALLGFLYNAEAEAQRQKYLAEAANAKATSP